MTASSTALIVVDVQRDFSEGGSLAVTGGNAVAAGIARLLADDRDRYVTVAASRDWHIDPGSHFSDHPDFALSWPPHCVVGTGGAEFTPALAGVAFDAVVDKGQYAPAYSAFDGRTADGTALVEWLRAAGAEQVEVCGLATDYCVRATALDAKAAGFGVTLRGDLVAAVAAASERRALAELSAAGVTLAHL